MVPYANGAGCLLLKQKTQLPRSILRKYSLGEEKHQIKKKKKNVATLKSGFTSFLFFFFFFYIVKQKPEKSRVVPRINVIFAKETVNSGWSPFPD